MRHAGVDRDQGVGHAAGGVVVAVDAEARSRDIVHGADRVAEFVRHHAAVGVAQGYHVRARLHGRPYDLKRVVRVGPVAVEEMLGVEEDSLSLGAQMLNNPITYAVNGKQYIAAMAGLTLFTFDLP